VTAVVNGKNQVLSLAIRKEAVDPEDVEMLQDLVMAAVNEALKKVQEDVAAEMGKITGGLSIPGLF
jgi:DNA-binding YbaB/EbfC family protein